METSNRDPGSKKAAGDLNSSSTSGRHLSESGFLSSSTNEGDFEKTPSCDVLYVGDADLMVMDNLVRDVRNFRDALNQLSFVLSSAATTTRRGVFSQGTRVIGS
jgi:hypothetical protein